MRIIIASILIFFSTVFIILSSPQMPKNIQIANTNAIFEETEVLKDSSKDINLSNKSNIQEKIGYKNYQAIEKAINESRERSIEKHKKAEDVFDFPDFQEKEEIVSQAQFSIEKGQEKPNFQTKKLGEREEQLAWNKWHADVQTESLRLINKANLDRYVEYRTIVIYSFVVNNKRELSNVSIDMVIPLDYYEAVQKTFLPVLETLNYNDVLKFPEGTKRTQNKFIGTIISDPNGRRVADPSEYSDYETVKQMFSL